MKRNLLIPLSLIFVMLSLFQISSAKIEKAKKSNENQLL